MRPDAVLGLGRDFTLLWTGQAVSLLGSRMAGIALTLWVLAETGSPLQAGLVASTSMAASAAVQLPAGWAADHLERRRLMLICDASAALVALTLWGAVMADRFWLSHVLAVVAVQSLATAVRGAAEAAGLANLVPSERLSEAVAVAGARAYGATLVGMPVGAALFGVAAPLPFLLDIVSFGAALVCTASLRQPLQPTLTARTAWFRTPLGAVWKGLLLAWREPFIRVTAVMSAVCDFVVVALSLVVFVALSSAGTSAAAIGATMSLGSAGALVGAILAPRFLRRRPPLHVIITAVPMVGAVALVLLTTTASTHVTGLAYAVFFLPWPLWEATIEARWLALTDDTARGRVYTSAHLASTVFIVAAPATAGLLIDATSTTTTGLLLAALLVAVSVASVLLRSTYPGNGPSCIPSGRQQDRTRAPGARAHVGSVHVERLPSPLPGRRRPDLRGRRPGALARTLRRSTVVRSLCKPGAGRLHLRPDQTG